MPRREVKTGLPSFGWIRDVLGVVTSSGRRCSSRRISMDSETADNSGAEGRSGLRFRLAPMAMFRTMMLACELR